MVGKVGVVGLIHYTAAAHYNCTAKGRSSTKLPEIIFQPIYATYDIVYQVQKLNLNKKVREKYL